jgi:hypothetical protein
MTRKPSASHFAATSIEPAVDLGCLAFGRMRA